MSEEIRNPGTEMNDAALEGVSTGETNTPPQLSEAELSGVSGGLSKYQVQAEYVCGKCPRYRKTCGTDISHFGDLVAYMQAHGMVYSYSSCPYYNE